MGLTYAQRVNKRHEKIWQEYHSQNNDMKEYLDYLGVSKREINKLERNTALHGNSLADKIHELGKWKDFWKFRDIKQRLIGGKR